MIFNVAMFVIMIIMWMYAGVLSYSFYSTSQKNHYKFKHLYQAAVLNIFICVLGIYYLISGNEMLQPARWLSFTFLELTFLYFVLRSYSDRHFELIVTSIYLITLILSTLWLNLIFNIMVVMILIVLCLASKDEILKKWFSISFVLYGFTSIIPTIYTVTGTESILMGLIFTTHFVIGVKKIYVKEKVDEELKKLLLENKL